MGDETEEARARAAVIEKMNRRDPAPVRTRDFDNPDRSVDLRSGHGIKITVHQEENLPPEDLAQAETILSIIQSMDDMKVSMAVEELVKRYPQGTALAVRNSILTDTKFMGFLTAAFSTIGWSLTPKSPSASFSDGPSVHTSNTDASPALEGITPEQMQAWREVNAARSRAQRTQLTPEQAAHQSKQGAKRVAASRERMTPEQHAARSATEAQRLRRKRALAKAPQP